MAKKLNKLRLLCSLFVFCVLNLACTDYLTLANQTNSPGFVPKSADNVTVAVPEFPSLALFLGGVYDTYEYTPPYDGAKEGGDPHVKSPAIYRLYMEENASVGFNQSVACRLSDRSGYKTVTLPQGNFIYMKDASELTLFIDENGAFVTEEYSTIPIALQISIVAWNKNKEELIQGELAPIKNLSLRSVYMPEQGVWRTRPKSVSAAVDGKETGFIIYPIGGENYFRLRDVASNLALTRAKFGVRWKGETGTLELSRGETYMPDGREGQLEDVGQKIAVKAQSAILLDGAKIALEGYKIDGYHYFKMEDLAKIFDFSVFWDNNPREHILYMDTSLPYWIPLRGNSAAQGSDAVLISMGIHAHLGHWEYKADQEGIIRTLDLDKYENALAKKQMKEMAQTGERNKTIIMPELLLPGTQGFLFGGEKPGVVELRFIHVNRSAETESEPEIRAACRIRVFEDKTLAVIAVSEGVYYRGF